MNDCLTCRSGFKFLNGKTCTSNCADGTYYESKVDQCVLCNSTLCDQCIERADKCTKCLPPLVLDRSTNTCKKCCSRMVYGKMKVDLTISCCNCPASSEYQGYCLADKSSSNSNVTSFNPFDKIKNIYQEYNSTSVIIFSLVLLIISILITMMSVCIYRKSRRIKTQNIEYRQLLNDYDDSLYADKNFKNDNLNDEEEDEDYELNTNDFKSFNGKIKVSKLNNGNNINNYADIQETNTLLNDKNT